MGIVFLNASLATGVFMKKRCLGTAGALGMALLTAAAPVALADTPDPDAFPPVEHASFHQPVFADEDVTVLNNLYPPNGDSGFHAHYRDLFYVVVQSSPSSGQGWGKPLAAAPAIAVGAAGFSPVGDKPRVHRVVNSDKGTLQIIVVELRRPTPAGTPLSSREAVPQYVQIVDNPRMRAWRLVLAPGQSIPEVAQGQKGVRVVVRGGLLTTITPGLPDQVLSLRPGDFAVQPAGGRRALRNGGTETIELVELELK